MWSDEMSKIIVTFDPPPIPDRQFDWRAMHDPDNSEGHHVGYGRTREEALADLERLDEERAEVEAEEWLGAGTLR
jgi:hypothetical protein